MSCDNIQGNGEMAHRMFLSFAGAIDAELATWIDENVPFPNSMVDRITPETTDADREDLDYVDAWPVVCEDFTQWVRSEEHTSELQSRGHLVCRLLREKKRDMRAPGV